MKLNRFTTIDSLFEILKYKKIRLSNPKNWEDKNDAEYLDAYRKRKGLKKVLALCFSDDVETIYHWKAYSETINSCCIEFDGDLLLREINGKKGFRYGKVNYFKINELKSKLLFINDVPFSKRYPYRNESEFRIIYDSDYSITNKYIPISFEAIKRVTINQKISIDLYNLIKNELQTKYNIKVNRSTVYRNKRWINHINQTPVSKKK
jgi:hypothetical protein